MKHVRILVLMSLFLFLSVQLLWAQEGRKVAYMNARRLVDSYYKTKEVYEKLDKESKIKGAELEKLATEVNKLREEVELLSKEAREKRELELKDKQRRLQDFDREARLDLERKETDMMKDILKEVSEMIKKYGKAKGYDIILDDRALLYADERLDITDDLIKTMNKK